NANLNSRIRVNYDKNVSKRAVDYIKLKTNNSFRVSSLSKNHISFSSGSIHNRETSFGTVETDKEVVVINEENSKHTFNIKTTDTSDDSIINLIIVQATDTIYEYFLKYNFTGYKYFKEDSSIDMSRYTGTVETFNSEGALVGITTVEDGSITNVEGSNSPCPEDEEVLIDNDTSDSTDNNIGGGAPNEDDTSNDDDYYSGNGTESDTGGGSWIDGGPDWQPCTLANVYYQPCPVQESTGDTTPQPHTAEQCGAGVGSGYVYVWDCSSTFRTSGSSDPCDGAVGVILEDNHEANCEELQTNSNNALFKQNMQTLKDEISGEVEKGFPMYNGNYLNPPNPLNPVVGNIVSGTAQETPNLGYNIVMKSIVHNHLKEAVHNHIGTFSPRDIGQFVNLITLHQQQNSPVPESELTTYLVCFEGNYALKISDDAKLYNFALKYGTNSAFKDEIDKFYEENNMAHGKPKQDQTVGFLKFLEEYDIGAKLYESDENFENWEQLDLNDSGNDTIRKPC
ncbi:MAG: hypothetical protein GYB35_14790, partial [Algicola sp.]|nr:hypothetical protein [Algicola sp.]